MAKLKPNQSVRDIVHSIANHEYQLPSIQRSFVWEQEQVLHLLDSIMCRYPIGSIMVWKTNDSIRCRRFTDRYSSGDRLLSALPPPGYEQAYMVLDGQQRLQALFISFKGVYDGKRVYLKVDEMADNDADDMNYKFVFLDDKESADDKSYIHIDELTNIDIEDIDEFVSKRLTDSNEEKRKLAKRIIGAFLGRFVIKDPLLIQEVSEKLDYNEVLEVFKRVNSGGTPLSRSDLLFCTLKLKNENMEESFIRVVDDLNNGGRFDFDTDFIIKAAFVIFNMKAKYDYKKLNDDNFLSQLDSDFVKLEKAITSLRDWLSNKAKIRAGRFLRSKLAIIPLIDYLMMNKKMTGPADGDESLFMYQYLYMSFFTRMYSRAPDSVLNSLHEILQKNLKSTPGVFPIREISEYMAQREKRDSYGFRDDYFYDLDLILNIIEGGVDQIPKKRGWSLERDHIFPRNQLDIHKITEDVNDVGNFRLIAKVRNISKSDTMPDDDTDFYGNCDPELQQLFKEACTNFTQQNFSAFVCKRKELIREKVIEFLGLEKTSWRAVYGKPVEVTVQNPVE